jgi:NADPH:quinone reductase
MKAIRMDQYGGEEQLKLVDVPEPKTGPGQVLVRISATSLNPIDPKRTSGNMKQVFPMQFPFIPGGDFSGLVENVGEGVRGFQKGDEVFGYAMNGGAYAEFIAIDADKVVFKPKKLNHIEAASLALVGQTALQMLDHAGAAKGQTILIHGAGGAVGGVAVQVAHDRGATVIGTAAPTSIDRVKSYGAKEVIDFTKQRFEDVVKNVDAVLDTVGGDVLLRSFGVLKPGGVVVSIVQPPSDEEAAKYKVKASMVLTDGNAETLKEVARLADAGKIKPFVGKVYPLSDVAKGWRDGRTQQVEGKTVFEVATGAGQERGRPTTA